ncbi:MAG: CcoQ/FixQ family Cbb3-type cytochrome c oxidase assembly chaperone [Ignavibacteriae bacterium]|nr:CcoQ/FixQ family Cbb3-type cytochrome c oxidase assembly chaperone [Ignavibacteriota bacterium]
MFSNYLTSIKDVEIFPVISLIIFFAVFVFVLIKVIKMDKTYINKMGNLPLENDDELKNKTENKNED